MTQDEQSPPTATDAAPASEPAKLNVWSVTLRDDSHGGEQCTLLVLADSASDAAINADLVKRGKTFKHNYPDARVAAVALVGTLDD